MGSTVVDGELGSWLPASDSEAVNVNTPALHASMLPLTGGNGCLHLGSFSSLNGSYKRDSSSSVKATHAPPQSSTTRKRSILLQSQAAPSNHLPL